MFLFIIRLDHWDTRSVEVVTGCCKDVMIPYGKKLLAVKKFGEKAALQKNLANVDLHHQLPIKD